jgi:hypothetical protein
MSRLGSRDGRYRLDVTVSFHRDLRVDSATPGGLVLPGGAAKVSKRYPSQQPNGVLTVFTFPGIPLGDYLLYLNGVVIDPDSQSGEDLTITGVGNVTLQTGDRLFALY